VTLASGIEAQLITAEAALQANDATTWLTIINSLRTNTTLYPAPQTGFTQSANLTNLAQPADSIARTNVMYSERAFWLFSTGHRLGDMRRLVRPTTAGGYGRVVNSVYPNGAWFKGGNYGDAIQMVLPVEELNNPNYHGCADRNP